MFCWLKKHEKCSNKWSRSFQTPSFYWSESTIPKKTCYFFGESHLDKSEKMPDNNTLKHLKNTPRKGVLEFVKIVVFHFCSRPLKVRKPGILRGPLLAPDLAPSEVEKRSDRENQWFFNSRTPESSKRHWNPTAMYGTFAPSPQIRSTGAAPSEATSRAPR